MKKSKLIGLSTMAVTLGVVGLAGIASAQTSTSGTSIVDKIATKFGLNKAEVQSVFDEAKSEKQAERKAAASERLQSLVDDGTITADQKTKIEAKQAELEAARVKDRTDIEKWATDNGIDAKYLMGGGRRDGNSSDDRLQSLVDDGTITADQKTKIEAKRTELQEKRDAEKTALETWATENDIDMKYLMGGGMKGPGGRGHGGPRGEGNMMGKEDDATSNTSTSVN